MKLGDIVINTSAGSRNPHKVLMYIRTSGGKDEFVALDGDKLQFYKGDRNIFSKVGEINFDLWKKLSDEAQEEE
jgi:hypothetical protein